LELAAELNDRAIDAIMCKDVAERGLDVLFGGGGPVLTGSGTSSTTIPTVPATVATITTFAAAPRSIATPSHVAILTQWSVGVFYALEYGALVWLSRWCSFVWSVGGSGEVA